MIKIDPDNIVNPLNDEFIIKFKEFVECPICNMCIKDKDDAIAC